MVMGYCVNEVEVLRLCMKNLSRIFEQNNLLQILRPLVAVGFYILFPQVPLMAKLSFLFFVHI